MLLSVERNTNTSRMLFCKKGLLLSDQLGSVLIRLDLVIVASPDSKRIAVTQFKTCKPALYRRRPTLHERLRVHAVLLPTEKHRVPHCPRHALRRDGDERRAGSAERGAVGPCLTRRRDDRLHPLDQRKPEWDVEDVVERGGQQRRVAGEEAVRERRTLARRSHGQRVRDLLRQHR